MIDRRRLPAWAHLAHGCEGRSCARRLGKYREDPSAEYLRQNAIIAAGATHEIRERSQVAFEADTTGQRFQRQRNGQGPGRSGV